MGVKFRKHLAKDNRLKTLWAVAVFALSVTTLGLSVKNIGFFREFILFLFAFIQGMSAVIIFVTCL